MEDLFRSYWWLLFPLGFFVAQAWSSFMSYKRDKARIDLLKSYAASGKEPPADLIAGLHSRGNGPEWSELDPHGSGQHGTGGGSTVFLVILFAGLSTVFGLTGYLGVFGVGVELYFVAAVLGVLALAFLVSGMFGGRRGR